MTGDAESPGAEESDAAVAGRATAGEHRAFTELMRRHKAAVYRIAWRHLGDADEAFDVVQDVFVKAWRSLDRYDPERPFSTWLFRITVNACRDRLRRRAVRSFFFGAASLDEPHAAQVADDSASPEARTAERENLRRVVAALARVPAGAREAFLLCAVEGLSHREAAEALGVTIKAVETRVARARKQIADELGQHGDDAGSA
jgi:RNA polymerase sigma-70 factor (ECF subfamily)